MSNKAIRRYMCAALTATVALLSGNAGGADLDLATVPLFVKASVSANIMFLLDNSASMHNIVPDAPYDSSVTYSSCPSSREINPASGQIDVQITSGGSPSFNQNGSNYAWGTASGTRCFNPQESYTARLYANDGSDGNSKSTSFYLSAQYTGNYLNWYFGNGATNWGANARNKPDTSRRMDIAISAANNIVDDLSDVRMGLCTYSTNTDFDETFHQPAQILVGIDDISTNHLTSLHDAINGLTPTGLTPLAETLKDIGRYFVQGHNETLTLHPGQTNEQSVSAYTVFNTSPSYASGVTQASPIENYCQQNFVVILTDGRPQADQALTSNSYLRDYDGDCASGCNSYDQKTNRVYESEGSDYLDDVAMALNDIDLRPDLDDPDGDEVKNNIVTYTVGFADDQVINDPLMQDTADSEHGGGAFLQASNAAELVQAFKDATDDIYERTKSSSTSVSFNVGSISSGAQAFQALFDSNKWTGQLLAYNLHDGTGNDTCSVSDPIGTVCTPAKWDASCVLTGGACEATGATSGSPNPAPSGRTLITYDAVGGTGVALVWNSLTTTQQATLNINPDGTTDTLGDERLDYLRGVRDLEESNGGSFRNRDSLLGDIAHSSPVYVGPPSRFYPLTWKDNLGGGTPEGSYERFRNSYSGRTGVTYVGANDGFLHGFRSGTINSSGNVTNSDGVELLGFMPSQAFDKARNLTDPNYSHRFYVDGPLVEKDVYFSTDSTRWRTVLMGGLGGGGQGMYALDITDPRPTNFSAGNAADLVLWEFTDADDADLGYSIGRGTVVRLHNGKWAAVFGNGYNNTEADGNASTSGNAVLYIVDIETGNQLAKLNTGQGASADPLGQDRANGLASVFPVDKDGDFITDYVYAGDLFGNIWRFDLTDTDKSNWAAPTMLFTATDGGNRQPITTRVVASKHPNGLDYGVMVFFGTGKFLENGDELPDTNITHTFYGIWDKDFSGVGDTIDVNDKVAAITPKQGLTRPDLQVQEIDAVDTESGNTFRRVTNNTIDWETQHGWYLDLKPSGGNNEGEMVIADPELRGGAVIFTTFIPDDSQCDAGGSGWLMVLDQATGGRFDSSPFDLDGNNEFTTDDLIDFGDGGDEAAAGIRLEDGSGGQSTVYSGDGGIDIVVTGENPDVTPIDTKGNTEGRQTWRQLR